MCSWCWGIAEEFTQLKDFYKDTYKVDILMGGLRPGTTETMDADMRSFLRHHWEEVNQRTQQPFNFDLLKSDSDFIYDTEPPSRAVIIARVLNEPKVFDFFKDVQQAFYVENQDTNDVQTYLPIAEKHGISASEFQKEFESMEAIALSYQDFGTAKSMGVTGFPTIVFGYQNQLHALAIGFSTFSKMQERLEHIKEENAASAS